MDFALKRIKVKMEKDEDVCGVSYAFSFNGVTTQEQVELGWSFPSAIYFTDDSPGLSLQLQAFVNELLASEDAATLDEEELKQILEDLCPMSHYRHSEFEFVHHLTRRPEFCFPAGNIRLSALRLGLVLMPLAGEQPALLAQDALQP